MATETTDVVTYGNTWAAVNAACAAANKGATSAIVMNYPHVGGIIGNGLSVIDSGSYGTHGIGYLTDELRDYQTRRFGSRVTLLRTTPHVFETSMMHLLKRYRVRVRATNTLSSVSKTGTNINSITCGSNTFAATNFLDCTEEGDLAKMAGVTMVVGRESIAQYNEPLAGFHPSEDTFTPFNCYADDGVTLLHGFSPYPVGINPGDADDGVQAYGFRVCVTQNKDNQRAWPKPAGYDPTLFEYLRRDIPNDPNWRPWTPGAVLDRKYDINGDYGVPWQIDWPNSTPAQRATILTNIYNEQFGWFWFLANDPSINPTVQNYVNSFRPCLDELSDTGVTTPGIGKELYVRMGRRMVGQYVMTSHDMQAGGTITKTDSMAMGFYTLDHHHVRKLAVIRGGVPGYIYDNFGNGSDALSRFTVPYEIPYRAGLPIITETTNLFVPVAASMSNVAGSSMRIDMHKANFASACGHAAAKGALTATAINSLDVPTLQTELDALGQVLHYTPPA